MSNLNASTICYVLIKEERDILCRGTHEFPD